MDTRIRDIDKTEWENFKKAVAVFNINNNKYHLTLNGALKMMIKQFIHYTGVYTNVVIEGVEPQLLEHIKSTTGKEIDEILKEHLETYRKELETKDMFKNII